MSTSYYRNLILVVYVAVVVGSLFPMSTSGTEFIVGDEFGWTFLYDYTTWTQNKVFHVGDTLVFIYPIFLHNVFVVNETAFANCTIPPPDQALTSGRDTITLDTPGKKWYICGVSNHCSFFNQKLEINVVIAEEKPGKSSNGGCSSMTSHLVFVAMVVVLVHVVLV